MSKRSLTASGAAALALALSTAPASAGFEWVAPQANTSYQQEAPQAAMPPPASSYATAAPEVISPVIISGSDAAPPTPAPSIQLSPPVATHAPTPSYNPPPPNPVGAPLNLATATIVVPPDSGAEIVHGFASQVPLALALRQILPAGYNFSIDQNVDMSMLVSYKGGKPWRDTLSDLLAPAGLAFHEQGSIVTIGYAAASSPAPVATTGAAYIPASPSAPTAAPIGAAPALLPTVNVGSPDGWSAERGDTLRKVLSDWCARNGVELQWLAEYDYPLEASAHFNGDFESAVRQLLAGFDNARPQPYAELHTNANAGQKLLVVQTRGNSYSN